MGHEDQFPSPRLSAGCGFTEETLFGTRANRLVTISEPAAATRLTRFDPFRALGGAGVQIAHSISIQSTIEAILSDDERLVNVVRRAELPLSVIL